jgi:hypothetical protein
MYEYGRNLRAALGASAGPYGYTLTVWTTGAVLIRAFGVPNPLGAFPFVVGAVVAFAFVGLLAFGSMARHFDGKSEEDPIRGSLHPISVGAAIAMAALVARYLGGLIAWSLGSFSAATAYFLVPGAESSVAYRWEHRTRDTG